MANGTPETDVFDKMKNAAGSDRDSGDSIPDQGRATMGPNGATEMGRSGSGDSSGPKVAKYAHPVSDTVNLPVVARELGY